VGTTGDPPHPTADPPHHTDDPPHWIVDSSTTIVWLEKSLASEPIDEEVKSQILDKFRAQMKLEYQSLTIGCNPVCTSDSPHPIDDVKPSSNDDNSNRSNPQPNTEN
ncbi:hypothetical protein, partial [Phormidium sp. CCY1219]|uniref:hypothetical protein n=1 Tax=Phormidium sp. CCY1219 TaxID=2886104 RepID=UPI002D1E64FF